jgi:uncharacterized protein YqjF (DUF2071 family)
MVIEPVSPTPVEPVRRPVMRQAWEDLTFLHWRYRVEDVRQVVPSDLHIDVCDGSAWVGLVPFRVTGLTLPNMPAIPWLSNFAETNVRTYVVDARGRRGVWFFSLDAARLAAVIGARLGYGLPYYWSKMRARCNEKTAWYHSTRRPGPAPGSHIEIDIGERLLDPDELEVFLTARFRLYAMRNGRLVRADVEHPRWPLHKAAAMRIDETLVRAAGLPEPRGEPLVHFSRAIEVLVSGPIPIRQH